MPFPRLPVLTLSDQRGDQRSAVSDIRSSGDPIFTTSGRAAIALALEALSVGEADTVLVPTYHCPTMIAPVERLGARAVFYPIREDGTPQLDWIRTHTAPARVMLVPHYFGLGRDLAEVRRYCDETGTLLLEDCAHCFFGRAGGREVGQWGDVTTGSLTKFFAGPDGGVLVMRHASARAVQLQSPNMKAEARAWIDAVEIGARYDGLGAASSLLRAMFGIKSRLRGVKPGDGEMTERLTDPAAIKACLDEMQIPLRASAVARWIVSTANVQSMIDRRQRNYRELVALVAGTQAQAVFPVLHDSAVPYVCPVMVKDADRVYRALRADKVPVFRWDVLWPGTPDLPGDTGMIWAKSLLQVACHQDLTLEHMRAIGKKLVAACETRVRERGAN